MRTSLVVLILILAAGGCSRELRPVRDGARWQVSCRDGDAVQMDFTGDFTGWEVRSIPADHRDGDRWVVNFEVPAPGIYRVQCVADGARRFAPEGFAMVEDDGWGGRQAVFWQPASDPATSETLIKVKP